LLKEATMTDLSTNTESTSARRPSAQLVADAVVTAYIHEISERHRPVEEPAEPAAGRSSSD
jgi:hypothetical protein